MISFSPSEKVTYKNNLIYNVSLAKGSLIKQRENIIESNIPKGKSTIHSKESQKKIIYLCIGHPLCAMR